MCLPKSILFSCFLESNAFIARFEINYSAFLKAVFQKRTLHRNVVLVGVDAEMVVFGHPEIKAFLRDALAVCFHRNTVDDVIICVAYPITVIDPAIGNVGPFKKAKNTQNSVILLVNKAIAVVYIAFDQIDRRIIARPLMHISACAHKKLCAFVNILDNICLLRFCVSYRHQITPAYFKTVCLFCQVSLANKGKEWYT